MQNIELRVLSKRKYIMKEVAKLAIKSADAIKSDESLAIPINQLLFMVSSKARIDEISRTPASVFNVDGSIDKRRFKRYINSKKGKSCKIKQE